MKACAVHESFQLDFIDHVAPMCAYLDIPYIFLDSLTYQSCLEFYPEVNAHLYEPYEFYSKNIINKFDTLLMSQILKREDFKKKYPGLKSLFLPHGNSDKGHLNHEMRLFLEPDIIMVYGQRMMDYLNEQNALDVNQHNIIIGNYRLSYWLKHKNFYNELLQKKVLKEFPKHKKRVLYAPTWDSNDGTFFHCIDKLIQALPQSYELIVKLHPFLVNTHHPKVEAIKDLYRHRKDIIFIGEFPIIFPLLETIDVFIGDMSSIGYDFLYFDEPLYFLSNHGSKKFYLYEAGVLVNQDCIEELFERIEEDRKNFSIKRKNIFNYTFGDVLSYDATKKVIHHGIKRCSLHR